MHDVALSVISCFCRIVLHCFALFGFIWLRVVAFRRSIRCLAKSCLLALASMRWQWWFLTYQPLPVAFSREGLCHEPLPPRTNCAPPGVQLEKLVLALICPAERSFVLLVETDLRVTLFVESPRCVRKSISPELVEPLGSLPFAYSPVEFKRNLSLLDIFFPGDLSKWMGTRVEPGTKKPRKHVRFGSKSFLAGLVSLREP